MHSKLNWAALISLRFLFDYDVLRRSLRLGDLRLGISFRFGLLGRSFSLCRRLLGSFSGLTRDVLLRLRKQEIGLSFGTGLSIGSRLGYLRCDLRSGGFLFLDCEEGLEVCLLFGLESRNGRLG